MAFPLWFKGNRDNSSHRKPEFMSRRSNGPREPLGQVKKLVEDRFENMAQNLKTYRVRNGASGGVGLSQ